MAVNDNSPDPIGIADGYTEPVHYEASPRDQELYGALYHMLEKAYEHKLPYARQWDVWRLYLKGIHLFRNRDTGEVIRVNAADQKRLYSQNNQIRIVARSLVGKLTAMLPTFRVAPATADPDEVYGGRAADAWAQFFRRKEKLDVLYTKLQRDIAWAGSAACEIYWDPEGGRRMAYCDAVGILVPDPELIGQPCEAAFEMMQTELETKYQEVCTQALMSGLPQPEMPPPINPDEVPKYVEMYEGDLKIRRWDPRNIFPEPGVEEPELLRYCFTVDPLPVTEVRRRFPHMAAFIGPERMSTTEKFARSALGAFDDSSIEDYMDDHALLITYHEKPTDMYPKGRKISMSNGFILEETENLCWKIGRLPLYFQWWERNPGEFWGESFVSQAWHRQKELNAQETIEREILEITSRPKVLNPIGSKIAADEITSTTAQVLKYNPGVKEPSYMLPPPFPNGMLERKERLKMDIREAAAVTGSDVGQMPSDPNGRAMAIVSAESDQQLGPITRLNHEEWRQLHIAVLILTREYIDPETQFAIGGQYAPMETYLLREALDLSAGWDLELELDDGLSRNQALRKNEALELWNSQVLMNPATGMPDLEAFARLSKIKMLEPGMDPEGSEQSAALMLIEKLSKGEEAQPQDEDNPAVFARTALNWLRKKGRKMITEDPESVERVREMYRFYTQWAVMLAQGQPGMPAQGLGHQQGPGGPQGATQQPPAAVGGGTGGVAAQAGAKVANADNQSESMARTQQNHEG